MSNMTYQAGLYGLSNLSRQAITLFATIFLARYLTQSNFGEFQLYQLLLGLMVAIVPFGLPRVLLVTLPINKEKSRSVWASNQVILIFFSIICFFLLFITLTIFEKSILGSIFDNPSLIAVSIAFSIPVASVVPSLLALKRYDLILLFTFFSRMLWLIGLVSAVMFYGNEISNLIMILMIINGMILFVSWILMFNITKSFKPLINIEHIKEDLKFATPLGIASIVGIIAFRIDKLIVSIFYDTSYYAIFSVGSIEIPLIGYIAGSACAVALPSLATLNDNGNLNAMINLWKKIIEKTASILFPTMGVAVFFARDIFVLVFGKDYSSATTIFILYTMLIPARVISYSTMLTACKETKRIMYIELISMIFNVILGLFLLQFIGPAGVVVATVITFYGAVICGYLPWFRDYFNIKTADIYPVKNLSLITISTIMGIGYLSFINVILKISVGYTYLIVTISTYFLIVFLLIYFFTGNNWFAIFIGIPKMFNKILSGDK